MKKKSKIKCCNRLCNEKATHRVGLGGLFHYVCFDHAIDSTFN